MGRVLLVDDDALLTELLIECLAVEDLNVHNVSDDEAGAHGILTSQYDAVVLDSVVPKMSGLDVLKSVRSQSTAPMIMLTAKGDDIDRIIGLETGTNDYVLKPCTPRELLVRINAILCHVQRGGEQNSMPDSISASDVILYPTKRQAAIRGEPLELANTEFNPLEVPMRHTGRIVSKETLSVEALDHKLAKFDRSIDVHISNIRHKLGDVSLIQTICGLGCLFIKN